MSFESLSLSHELLQALAAQGYTQPTPIQEQAIPLILAQKDLLAGAQTGTGKTAAFALPVLQRLATQPKAPEAKKIRTLVLAPTRELAAQVQQAFQSYGQHLSLSSFVVFGGVGMTPQIARLQQGVDVLVATPGRLLDLTQQQAVDLSAIEILVLDEADRMLDMGFIHDVKKILALLPAQKQSLLFSATFSDDILALAKQFLKEPEHIQVTPVNTTAQLITQHIYPVGREQKKAALLHLLTQHQWPQVLVFTRTKFTANQVADFLNENGISAMALHGNKSQTARIQALEGFKSAEIKALIATDIAARGIDIDDLPCVINFDVPNIVEDYVHRIGRTGRAGAQGQALSLVCMDEEGFMQDIEHFIQQRLEVCWLKEFGPAEGEKAEPIAMGRQVLWGGVGRPPPRDVMAAAARKARDEMFARIREKRQARSYDEEAQEDDPEFPPEFQARNDRFPSARGRRKPFANDDHFASDFLPNGQQPDPLRTSIDAISQRNKRPNGFGGRSKGPADPLRTSFGRIHHD